MQDSPLAFDFQATTPCSGKVLEAMSPYWNEFWGNPSTRQNRLGLTASAAVSLAREQIASFLNIQSERLIFTSGATEANNLALLGYARARALETGQPGHLITLLTEHHAVLDPLRQLQKEGFRLTELKPDVNGLLPIERLQEAFENDTILVSVMFANNEIGVVQPIAKLASLCRERGVVFHSDAAQALGYLHVEVDNLGIDLMSISGHKIYGPKGIGALVLKDGISISPLQWGGGQEKGLRSGTLPVPLIVGFAKAIEIANDELKATQVKLKNLRNQLRDGLRAEIPNLIINGSMDERLPHNLNITLKGVNGNRLHRELRPFISCSSGSACNNGSPSHVLLALGRSIEEAGASLRLSLGRETSFKDVEKAIKIISQVVLDL